MSNSESHPVEMQMQPQAPHCAGGAKVELLHARDVPLGGEQAMQVHRTLPQRARSFVGAWCFTDHYGPDQVEATGGMDVAPHPHTCLQTVSWLIEGEVTHHDSAGNHAVVRPGEVNMMTAGAGICHSEVSTQDTRTLHGLQLWVAMPDRERFAAPRFDHYVPEVLEVGASMGASASGAANVQARVLVGSLFGVTSPIPTYTPLLGAELSLAPGTQLTLDLDPAFEHGFIVDSGALELEGIPVTRTELAYTGIGERQLTVTNPGTVPARVMLLGGEPFTESIIMWWNFIGRSDEEIREFRREWQAEGERFGRTHGYIGHDPAGEVRIPAPQVPDVALKQRANPAPVARA